MNADQLQRLEALRNRSTRYEIAAVFLGRKYLLGYRSALSNRTLLDLYRSMPQAVRTAMVERAKITDDTPMSYTRESGWRIGDPAVLVIRRTGRTEREAIIEGELTKLSIEELP